MISKEVLNIIDKVTNCILVLTLFSLIVIKNESGAADFISHEEYVTKVSEQAKSAWLHNVRVESVRGYFYSDNSIGLRLYTNRIGQKYVSLISADELANDYCYGNPFNLNNEVNAMITNAEGNRLFQYELDQLFNGVVRGYYMTDRVNNRSDLIYYILTKEGFEYREDLISYLSQREENGQFDTITVKIGEIFDLDFVSNNALLMCFFPDKFTAYYFMPERSPYVSSVSENVNEYVIKSLKGE